jgi:hypothetical protein
MGERTTRRRNINPPAATDAPDAPDAIPDDAAATIRAAAKEPDAVQKAIDAMGDAGDRLPSLGTQTDNSTLNNILAQTEGNPDAEFAKAYEASVERGTGYLGRRRLAGNRSALVPPNATIHPKLNMWGLQYMGRWLILRWINKRPMVAQKRFEQGWQYFEGKEWCHRLGLSAENYLNEAGRIQTIDTCLAWASEEYVMQNQRLVVEKQQAMVAAAHDNLMDKRSKYIPGLEIISGSDEDVMGELAGRRKYAESRS